MHLFSYNLSWMLFNLYLALLPLLFGLLFFKFHNKILRLIFGLLWLLYLPNSIYVVTDIIHLVRQWDMVQHTDRILLIFQYSLLEYIGLGAFLFAVGSFEGVLKDSAWKKNTVSLLILLNFFIAFGMVLGRVERLNSWEVFTAPDKVVDSGIHVLTSPELLFLIVLFGLFANFFYFLFRKPVMKIFSKA
jgi:uncharacterized membrane protein